MRLSSMMERADLHTHSNRSDGTDTPANLVTQAGKIGLGGVALTDHDTIDGLREFMNTGAPPHLQRVPGVELSTSYEGASVHLLGYYVPRDCQQLEEKLAWLREKREERFEKMLEKARGLGINPSQEYLKGLLEGVESPGRPHIGRLLVEYGIVRNLDEAFERYLHREGELYVKKAKLTLEEAIGLFLDSAIVPIIAHPFDIKLNDIIDRLEEFKRMGAYGVEATYDYAHSNAVGPVNSTKLCKMAKEMGWIMTGGTDYHGAGWRTPLGTVCVPIKVVDELRNAAKDLGNTFGWEEGT